MNETFMKQRPVLPLLLSMALPMVFSMLINSLYNIVDSFFVAKLSEDAMTALSLVYPIQNFINALAIGFGVGISAVISLHLGAGQEALANRAATHGLVLAALHGIVLTAVTIPALPRFLWMFTQREELVSLGTRYERIAFAFSLVISLTLAYEKIFQSVGRMRVTMVGLALGCIANILMDPLLIFGIGPFPRMEMEGAALATGLGQVLTLFFYLAVYALRPVPVRIGRAWLVPDGSLDRQLYSIGIPATLNLALPSLLISALNGILAGFSQMYVVILGVYYKLQTFLYLPANGIVQGMRPIIGYNYGAGEHGRVGQIYRVTLALCGGIMALGTVLCLLCSAQLISLFTKNPETIQAGTSALRIISMGFLISTVSVASCGALEGLGKGGPSLLISLLQYAVLIIPAAFCLSRILGPSGVWHAFWLAEAVTAVCAFFIYRNASIPRQASI